jgi:hypothetical protein
MKKRFLYTVVVVAIVTTASWNLTQHYGTQKKSSLALLNIEALANGENNAIDQEGHKYVASPRACCKAYQPREFKCSSVWPDC